MRHSHDFPPYHFGIKARKSQSAEAGICSHQWHRDRKRVPSPAFSSSRMTGRIYRWACSQELIATSQATYG